MDVTEVTPTGSPAQPAPTAAVLARRLWLRVEHVHAVVYFDDRVADAVAATGLRGWWAGYVAGRAAPLGRVPAAVVQALFFGFAAGRITRGVPAAWTVVQPAVLWSVRSAAVGAALRDHLGDHPDDLERLLELLDVAVQGCEVSGRGLFAAHLGLDLPDDPLERLWLRCTQLREHRGDGHVAACVAAGLDGVTANELAVARGVVPPGDQQRRNRGWSEAEWQAGHELLQRRGLVRQDRLTDRGRSTVATVEAATDLAAASSIRALGVARAEELIELLDQVVAHLRHAAVLPFPNAVGLPEHVSSEH